MRPPTTVAALFAFEYAGRLKQANSPCDGWLVYSPVADYTRLGFVKTSNPSPSFRLLKNSGFRFSPTYPQLMIVPSQTIEDQLVKAARARVHARLPVAVWRHPVHKCVLVRSSEPDFRLFHRRDESDEFLLQCYRDAPNSDRKNPIPLNIFLVRSPSFMRIGEIGMTFNRSLVHKIS